MKTPHTFALVAVIVGAVACTEAPRAVESAPTPQIAPFGIDLAQMDASVRPGDDFYKYVNGRWLATATIPPDKSSYGTTDMLVDKSEADVRTVVEGLPAEGGSELDRKVADFYGSWMDTATIERRGLEPLNADLDAIAALRSKQDLVRLMAHDQFSSPIGRYISADPADTTKYVVNLTQDGLGMPVRDYYLAKGEKFDRYRAAYKAYVSKILELIGDDDPAAHAAKIVALETRLAQVHWAPERQRDVKATNNPVDRAGLAKMVPGVNWDDFLSAAGIGSVQHLVVNETTALSDGAKLLDSEPLDTWKRYLAFHVASDYAPYLPAAFDEANFQFFSKTLRGVEQQRERWKRGVTLLNRNLGEAVGELYVSRFFPPASKAAIDQLVANLKTAMGARLATLAWMDDATRQAAQKKLASFEPRVGYPAKWRDYSSLTVARGTLFENVRAAREFEWQRQVKRLDQPVDRTEWEMTPQTVNAYYDPLLNQITFPAAILQPPFFDPAADPAVNYGAIGAVIGHEMGHGFDDQGREFDESGRIRNWWTPETSRKFEEATARLARQYDAFCPIPGLCVNGRLTMGENIGDLGGLEMAYTAYRLSLKGNEAPVLDRFTGDQRFFLAHAQIWRALQREDALRSQILGNPHAPSAARGALPERNIDAWYGAFDVKPGDKAYIAPDDRVHIW
jgi:endothelin-converting enzyme/putative endopeptidase